MKTATTKRADRGPRTTNPSPPGLPSLRVYHGPKRRAAPDVPPEKPSATSWEIGGYSYVVRVWPYALLMRLPLDQMPDPERCQAHLNIGWVEIIPAVEIGGER